MTSDPSHLLNFFPPSHLEKEIEGHRSTWNRVLLRGTDTDTDTRTGTGTGTGTDTDNNHNDNQKRGVEGV